MKRREFITLLGGAVAAWPRAGARSRRCRARDADFLDHISDQLEGLAPAHRPKPLLTAL
jgi:hypothetical protein